MNNIKKVVIADDFLVNKTGHFYEYNKSIIVELKKRGIHVDLYCNRHVEESIKNELSAIPFFKIQFFNQPKRIKIKIPFYGRIKFVLNYFLSIHKIINLVNKENDDLLFFPSLLPTHFLPLSILLFFSKINNKVVIVFRTSILNKRQKASIYYRICYFFLKGKVWSQKITLCSDSEVICNQVKNFFRCNICLLPIPHTHISDEREIANTSNKNDKIKLYLPGEARLDKGIELLINTIEIISKSEKNQSLQFSIQFYQFAENENNPRIITVRNKLKELRKTANVELLKVLSSSEYYKKISEADIILIPYQIGGGYDARTSGVFAEAIVAGKPVIVTKGSWMEIQLHKIAASGISISDSDPQLFANAIIELVDNIQNYRKLALEKKEAWLAEHNAVNFCNILLKTCVN